MMMVMHSSSFTPSATITFENITSTPPPQPCRRLQISLGSLHNGVSLSLSLSLSASINYRKRIMRMKQHCCNAQLQDLAPATSAAYGALLLGGGLFAYARSGSKGSLLGGVSGAALMAITYFLMQAPETRGIGDALGFGSAFLFSSVFGIRLAATRKVIPAAPLLGISFCALAVFVSAYLHDRI